MAESPTKLGGLLDPDSEHIRDAVHVAVYPAVAAEPLRPGEHVGLTKGGLASSHVKKLIGIVDPFLPEGTVVDFGEHFWLCLYPGSITSLRHLWDHPAFELEKGHGIVHVSDVAKVRAKEWIIDWAEQYGCTFEEMMEAASSWTHGGDYYSKGGTFEGAYVPDEFWEHYRTITGESGYGSFFSCSC